MITRLPRVSCACILASTILTTVAGCQHYFGAAHAATYYVAPTGNNSNPGTENKPFRTIAYAVSTMVAGDTTYVMDGTYNEGVIRFQRSGTQAAPIKLLNYSGHAPKIVFNDPAATDRILIQSAAGQNKAIGWITIEGFELTNGHDGIKYYNLHDSTIRRNWIHDNRFMGIMGNGGTRLLFDRNRVNRNGWFEACEAGGTTGAGTSYCNQHHGFYLYGSNYTLTNNVIYDNLSYGIQQNGSSTSTYSSSRHPGTEFAGATNWAIANNTLAYSNYRAGIVVWGGECDGTRIENNILYENGVKLATSGVQGINCTSCGSSENIIIRNNHAYASGTGARTFIVSSAFHASTVNSGNVVNVSSPAFVNAPASLPDSPNFALTAQSPAIDAGVPLAEVRIAFDGTPRPQGRAPDIGAYEYNAGADAKPPAAPVALQAH